MKINNNKILVLLTIFAIVANASIFFGSGYQLLRIIFNFMYLTFIPGILIMRIIRFDCKNSWFFAILSLGFSLGVLMFLGLFINHFLPYFGISNPLDTKFVMWAVNTFNVILITISYFVNKNSHFIMYLPKINILNTLLLSVPVIFPVMSILGSMSLNNNSNNILTMLLLGLVALYMLILFVKLKLISSNLLLWNIFLISLSILFATSMRSWYITGHDIQQEFFVYNLTKDHLRWQIGFFQDAYNICLSLNILPVIYKSMLNIGDVYIFKIIFQIIFSFFPVGAYIFFNKYSNKKISFIATFLLIAFPTFGQDMPMLARQEISLIFFQMMLLVLFDTNNSNAVRNAIFTFFGFCMILSHYSTSYIALAIFIGAFILSLGYRKLRNLSKLSYGNSRFNLSIVALSLILVFALVWNSQLKNNKYSLYSFAARTFVDIKESFSQDSKSNDISYSLFSWKKLDKNTIFDKYITDIENSVANNPNPEKYFSKDEYNQPKITLVDEYRLPPTLLGVAIAKVGIDPYLINNLYKQISPKIIQIMLIVGIFILFIKKSKYHLSKIDTELLWMMIVCVALLAMFTIIPALSTGYGAFRFFYQSLVILSLPTIIGSLSMLTVVKSSARYFISFVFFLVFFLSISGFTPQLTGGYYPLLILNNSGLRYDCLYTHKSEIFSLDWLSKNIDNNYDFQSIQANQCMYFKILNYAKLPISEQNVVPALVTRDGYVYMNYTNSITGNNIIYINGTSYIHNIPNKFFDDNKDLIYSNRETKIYK